MKIQSRRVLRWAGTAAAAVVRTIVATSKVREYVEDPDWHPFMGGRSRNFLLSTWHENLLVAAWYLGRLPYFHTLASPSRDGEIIAGCAAALGMTVMRGSSFDGGVKALREIVGTAKAKKRFRFGVTPDGPRGPRRVIQPGVAFVAARAGLPVVALGIACENAWRAPSWDRLQIPKPFQRIQTYMTAPLWAPTDQARSGHDKFASLIAAETNRAQQCAEELLANPIAGGRRRVGRHSRAA